MPHSERVDFLILAPLPLEIDALRKSFANYSSAHAFDGLAYDECVITGREGQLRVRIVRLPEAGVLRAGVFATRLLLEWEPRYVISFGIAGGFCEPKDPESVNLEHVLLAEHVFYYELAKETGGTLEQGPEIFPTSSEFSHRVRNYLEEYKTLLPKDCRIHVGRLASGEKLIDDPKSGTRQAIKKMHRKMLGFEQEAAGVGAACRWTDTRNKPGFLVVKGVSDCGKRKGKTNRSRIPSANNAAGVLRALLEKTELRVSFDYDAPLDKIRRKAEVIQKNLGPFLAEPLHLQPLTRVLQSVDELPTVFYHWRARHNHVHWVDFYQLLLLRRFCEIGIRAHILLTEVRDSTTEEGKKNASRLVFSLLGDETKITWYSELSAYRDQYEQYARKMDFDDAARQAVSSAEDSMKVKTGNLVDADWLQFIAWSARSSQRCFLLTWQRHASVATELTKLLFLYLVPILTPDLRIGPALGKFDQPSVGLVIDPPNYESIIGWLKQRPEPVYVHDLANHLTLGKPQTNDPDDLKAGAKALLEGAPDLQSLLLREDSDFEQSSRALLNEMAIWNDQFFANWHRRDR